MKVEAHFRLLDALVEGEDGLSGGAVAGLVLALLLLLALIGVLAAYCYVRRSGDRSEPIGVSNDAYAEQEQERDSEYGQGESYATDTEPKFV